MNLNGKRLRPFFFFVCLIKIASIMQETSFPSQRKSTPIKQLKNMQQQKTQQHQQQQQQQHQGQGQETRQRQNNNNNEHYEDVESEMEQIIDEEVYINNGYHQQQQQQTFDESAITTIPYEMKKDVVLQNLCNIDDVQLFIIVVVVFLLVQILPIKKVLERCVAIDRIPYGDSIAKAFISGIIIFITMKLTRA
jgi:hypothetical protein